jgi:hypothetical protein
MSNVARCPDLYHAEILVTSNDGLTWSWKRLPETKLDEKAAIDYAVSVRTPWRRVIKQTMIWNGEGEQPEQNGCLPGLHCLSKSRDCAVNGCLRELKEIKNAPGECGEWP